MNTPQILLVDDEHNILTSLQRLFFDEEYKLHTASNGEEALEILKDQEMDLIIADYRMPGMSGTEFFRQVRQIQPDAIRIILSGYANIQSLTDAINEGHIYKFIFKPWNDQDFKNTVRLALEQKALVMENKRLTEEITAKNRQLEEYNLQLERTVEERTRELQFQNKVLQVSQEIMERLPFGVMGVSSDDVVVLMNLTACELFLPGIGLNVPEVIPEELWQKCQQVREESGEAGWFEFETGGSILKVSVTSFSSAQCANGTVISFLPVSVTELKRMEDARN